MIRLLLFLQNFDNNIFSRKTPIFIENCDRKTSTHATARRKKFELKQTSAENLTLTHSTPKSKFKKCLEFCPLEKLLICDKSITPGGL
jgi:hypothetical protein